MVANVKNFIIQGTTPNFIIYDNFLTTSFNEAVEMSALEKAFRITNAPEIVHEQELNNIRAYFRLTSNKSELHNPDYAFELEEEDLEKFYTAYKNYYGYAPRDGKYFVHTFRQLVPNFSNTLSPTARSVSIALQNGTTRNIYCNNVEYTGYHTVPFWSSPFSTAFKKLSSSINEAGFSSLRGINIFPILMSSFANRLVGLIGEGTYVFFSKNFAEEKNKSATKFVQNIFPAIEKFQRTLLSVDGIENAAAIYRGVHHNVIAVPIEFYNILEGCTSASQAKDRLQVIAHKLSTAIDSHFNSAEARRKRTEEGVNNALTSFFQTGVRTKEDALEFTRRQCNEHKQHYVRLYQQAAMLSIELEGLRKGNDKVAKLQETIKEQLDEMYKVNKIKAIRFDPASQSLVLSTNFLHFYNSETRVKHQLGELDVHINMYSFDFHFENKTMKWAGDFDHPHIRRGRPCFGNFGVGLPELLMEGQIYTFTDMVIAFLQECNTKDEWGRNAIYWPVADESDANETWFDIKKRIKKDMMPAVEEPNAKTDEELLDQVEENIEQQIEDFKNKNKKKKNQATATEMSPGFERIEAAGSHDLDAIVLQQLRDLEVAYQEYTATATATDW